MNSFKIFFVSLLMMVVVGLTSISASAQSEETRFLPPIISMILDQNSDADSSKPIPDDPGGNFVVSSRAFDDTVPDVNCDQIFTSTSRLAQAATATLAPGTTLCLADGTYRSLELNFGGAGTEDAPIKVAAQNSGQAIISGGDMGVNMTGTYVVLQGIVFRDGSTANSDIIQTRGGEGDAPCNHCRITEIALIDIDAGRNNVQDRGRWLNIFGTHNRIDHNWFSGKVTGAPLLNTNRDVADTGTAADVPDNFHVIDHNYFGNRAPIDGRAYARNGDNEHEGIQLGTSFAHEGNSASTVAFNYFEKIDGEAEVISVKSSGNVIFNNTIRDSYGSITNRHGARTLIANNFVIGDGHPFSGGLRIVDDSHRVINNYVEGARFLDTRFHGGIVLHNTDRSTSNGYQTFENNLVAFNTVTNSVNSLNVDGGNRSGAPEDVRFVNNVIDDAVGPVIRDADLRGGLVRNSVYAGNYVEGPAFSDDPDITSHIGFIQKTIDLQKDAQGIARPTQAEAAALIADSSVDISSDVPVFGDVSPFEPIVDDLDGQSRGNSPTSGADQLSSDTVKYGVLSADDVGPINYRPTPGEQIIARVPINNPAFDDLGQDWTITTGAQITTNDNEAFAGGAAGKFTTPGGRISQEVAVEPNTNYAITAFTNGPILLGADVNGVEVSGEFNNSRYRHTQFEFNSGTASTVTVFAALDDFIESNANIATANFNNSGSDRFNSRVADDNPWTIIEGSNTIGQVQDSSTSATGGSGSLRLRYNNANELGGSPALSQVITGILPNTDYELSSWVRADDNITATMGVFEGATSVADPNATVLSSTLMDFSSLPSSPSNNRFRRASVNFNSGANTTLTLFFRYTPIVIPLNELEFEGNGTIDNSNIRIDDVELTFPGPTPEGEEAFVDEIRLVSFPGLTSDGD